jgi:predicted XRE-type DNA-binding protein
MKKRKIKFEEGSGNVFADLGLKDSDELFARAQFGFCVYKIVKDKNLKQREISELLGIAQSDVSHLMSGHWCTTINSGFRSGWIESYDESPRANRGNLINRFRSPVEGGRLTTPRPK